MEIRLVVIGTHAHEDLAELVASLLTVATLALNASAEMTLTNNQRDAIADVLEIVRQNLPCKPDSQP